MNENYTKVAIILHWMIAIAMIVMLAMGMMLEDVPEDYKGIAYQTHKSVGLSILLLSCVRVFWRLSHPVPPLPAGMKNWEMILSKVVHVAFYLLIIALPLSGWALVSSSPRNFPTIFFGLFEWPHLPVLSEIENKKEVSDSFGEIHETLANITIVLLVLHVGAALKHHFILKDNVLIRMAPWVKKAE